MFGLSGSQIGTLVVFFGSFLAFAVVVDLVVFFDRRGVGQRFLEEMTEWQAAGRFPQIVSRFYATREMAQQDGARMTTAGYKSVANRDVYSRLSYSGSIVTWMRPTDAPGTVANETLDESNGSFE